MNSELLDYIEREIVPRYEHFDKAHGTSHVRQVMEQSMTLAEHYDVDKAMVYTIAAYHDTGLCEGRERLPGAGGRSAPEDSECSGRCPCGWPQ